MEEAKKYERFFSSRIMKGEQLEEGRILYKFNNKMYELLDKVILELWPKEGKRFQQLVKETKDIELADEMPDEYFELKDTLREVLIQSISRFYTPFKRD